MNLLFISKPGLNLLKIFKKSETAKYAIRFYDPIELSIGILLQISTIGGAISLTSDLRYFLKRYTMDHLFQMQPGIFFTEALAKRRYLTRNNKISDTWAFRLIYWIGYGGEIFKCKFEEWNSKDFLYGLSMREEESLNPPHEFPDFPSSAYQHNSEEIEIQGGYLLEVWCTRSEYELV